MPLGGAEDRREVRELAGLHLDEAERDERVRRPDRVGQVVERHLADRPRPRSFATSSGKSVEVNSSAGTTTSSPAPSIPATSPVPTDAAGIVAIVSGDAPMSDAKARGSARRSGSSQSVDQSPVPACQPERRRWIASTVACGGSP